MVDWADDGLIAERRLAVEEFSGEPINKQQILDRIVTDDADINLEVIEVLVMIGALWLSNHQPPAAQPGRYRL